ncbi:tyrosine-type recombinase/integrase [Burkholderia metallica]|uniref:tyrosine-type recombinase/integrase n=1 Tax=Burkholderia metallica TaxID=488729 RepID=UPI0015764ABE|nr:tyrosine-type recombinase/integrase [Burkholderia metallica]NTZ08183.1 site-specific integrase [Burkholderia metallica]
MAQAKESIRTKTARAKLAPRRDPYWLQVVKGLHIGYRKTAEGGTWIGRRKGEEGRYQFQSFGTMDTYGGMVDEFESASRKVREWADNVAAAVIAQEENGKPKTVADVCALYVEDRRKESGDSAAYNAERVFKRRIYDHPIASIALDQLTKENVNKWRESLVPMGLEADDLRRAKDYANREFTSFKAALNFGYKENFIKSNEAWKAIGRYKGVSKGRKGWLQADERNTLLDAMPDDLRTFAKALLLTGARPGELMKANIADYDKASGILTVINNKGKQTDASKRTREVVLSNPARELFEQAIGARKLGPIFIRAEDSKRWTALIYAKPFRQARKNAKLPHAVMYSFRHSYISEMLSQGVDIFLVAKLTGTSSKMIDATYGHLTLRTAEMINRVAIL